MPERIDENRQRGRKLAATWVVEVVAGERWAPIVKDTLQATLDESFMHAIFEQKGEAEAVERGGEDQVAVVQGEAAFHANVELATVLLEIPGVEAAQGRKA